MTHLVILVHHIGRNLQHTRGPQMTGSTQPAAQCLPYPVHSYASCPFFGGAPSYLLAEDLVEDGGLGQVLQVGTQDRRPPPLLLPALTHTHAIATASQTGPAPHTSCPSCMWPCCFSRRTCRPLMISPCTFLKAGSLASRPSHHLVSFGPGEDSTPTTQSIKEERRGTVVAL